MGLYLEFIFPKKLWWNKCIKTDEMIINNGNLCVKHVKWVSWTSCCTCSTILCMLYPTFVPLRRNIGCQLENWEILISDFYPMGLYLEFIFPKKLWWNKCIKTGEMLTIHGNLCVKHVKWVSCISCSTCSTILCMPYPTFVPLRRNIRCHFEN